MTLLATLRQFHPAVYAVFDPGRLSLGAWVKQDHRELWGGSCAGTLFTGAFDLAQRRRIYEVALRDSGSGVDDGSLIYADVGIVNAAGVTKTTRLAGSRLGGFPDVLIGVELDESAQTLKLCDATGLRTTLASIGAGPWTIYVNVQRCVARLNAGQEPFAYAAQYGADARPWTEAFTPIGPFYLADDPYLTLSTDSEPNRRFEGRLQTDSVATLRKSLWFWPWDTALKQKTSASFNLANHDGRFDALAIADMRDGPVQLRVLPAGEASYDHAFWLPELLIDAVTVRDDATIVVSLTDPLVLTQNIATVAQVNAATEAGASNAQFPWTFGVACSVPPIPIGGSLTHSLGDDPSVGATLIRDKGYPYTPTANPPDWTRDAFGNVSLARVPAGIVTADVGAWNCALAANGATVSSSSALAGYPVSTLINGDSTGSVGGNWAIWNQGTAGHYPEWATVTFSAEQTIDRVVVVSLQDGATQAGAPAPTEVTTGTAYVVAAFDVDVWNAATNAWVRVASVTGNTLIRRTVRFDPISTRQIRITINSTPKPYLHLVEIEAWTVPVASTFDRAITYLASRSGGAMPQGVDTFEVDDTMGYAGPIGFHTASQVKIADVCQKVADSFNACLFLSQTGEFRGTVLRDPDTFWIGADLGTVTEDDLLADLLIVPDFAPNLSTRATGQANYARVTDFATDALITPDLRAQLSADYRIVRSYTGPIARMYTAARNAPPMPTLLHDPNDVQRFIDHLAGLYRVPRVFVKALVRWIGGPLDWRQIDLDRTFTLKHRRYGLQAGRRAYLCGLEIDPIHNTVLLTGWMRGPA